MAKDGTNRGGARVGSGRKPKALADKISKGSSAMVMELPEPPAFEGADVPPIKEYLKARQKNGKDLCAAEVYEETWKWLKERGCDRLVNSQLVEQYAMSVSRWIQCEECISEYGFLAKHPTTGNAIASPYVSMSQTYMKQVNQIYQIVKENCSVEFSGNTPQDDVMERLLRTRKVRSLCVGDAFHWRVYRKEQPGRCSSLCDCADQPPGNGPAAWKYQ